MFLLTVGLLACASNPPNPTDTVPVADPATIPPAPRLSQPATPTPIPTRLPTPTAVPSPTPTTPVASPTPKPTARASPAPAVRGDRITITGQLRLMDNLDDPNGYCIDVPGFGNNVRLDLPLQAHTCKPGAADQTFSLSMTAAAFYGYLDTSERIVWTWTGKDFCFTWTEFNSDSVIVLAECSKKREPEQLFKLHSDDLSLPGAPISFANVSDGRCVGVEEGPGEPAGRNHLRRDLTLYRCSPSAPRWLITWELVER